MAMDKTDYYQILGVDKKADQDQIREAFRKSAFQYHPDRGNTGPDEAEKMKAVNEAYAVLSDPEKRREYDEAGEKFGIHGHRRFRSAYSDRDIFQHADIDRIFEEIGQAFRFGSPTKGNKNRRFFHQHGPGFHFSGFVFWGRLDNRFLLKGLFPVLESLKTLMTSISKKPARRLPPQDGDDLTDMISISLGHAETGGPYAYDHVKKSKKLVVSIPAGIKDGQKIRLAGMGKDGRGGGKPGDLLLKVKIGNSLIGKIKNLIQSRTGR